MGTLVGEVGAAEGSVVGCADGAELGSLVGDVGASVGTEVGSWIIVVVRCIRGGR